MRCSEWLDTNQDKILARGETPKEFHERFDASDRNKNGLIDADEIDTAFQSPDNMAAGGNIIQAIRGGGSGDVTKTHLLWSIDPKTPSNISSPLFYNGRLYLVKSGGMSSCYDAKDGKSLWDRSRLGNFGDYFASAVAADGKIYVAGKNGFVVVLEDGPELKVLGKNDLGEEIIATPSIADGRLYVRTRENLLLHRPGEALEMFWRKRKRSRKHSNSPHDPSAAPKCGMATPAPRWARSLGAMKSSKTSPAAQNAEVHRRGRAEEREALSAIRVDGDTAGRKAFGGAKTFENADVAAITARFREKAAKMGFEVIEADPLPGTFAADGVHR
ncbi:MAG: PQQ-binding-like beta-propeller repeat protein [Verrucomicrobiaceae bacterium]|nr:PQQ-binding-like beta-propeller repeat protein [Verrucomicrobiaceae bacterium]